MLFQPSNIYPSTFSGIGAGTVDVTQGLNVSWQVNGDTPMTAYQIKIYQNDSGSTLMYDSGSVTVSPAFEPHDKYGNATYFTAIISAAALSTAGIVNGYQYGYKMLITQWWGVSDYVEQTSASVFITRSTPNISIDAIPNPVAASSITITATYSQAQGDPISTVEWVFALAGSESNPIRKTGAISTQVLSFDADGLITGNTYSIMCNVVTSTGMEASTGYVQFPVLYSSSSLGINYQLAQLKNSSAVYLSWDDLGSNILAYPYTDTTKTTNGITFTVNGEGDVVASGTASADAYFTIAEGTSSQLGMTAGKKFVITSGYSGSKIVITETNGSNVVVSTIEGSDPLQYIATSTTNTLKISIVIPSGSVLSPGQQLKPMIAKEDKIVAYNAVSANIEPIQDLHGYSHPWPGGTGINKLSPAAVFTQTDSGITLKSYGDGRYALSGTATASFEYLFDIPEITMPSTVYIHLLNSAGGSSNTAINIDFYNGSTRVDFLGFGTVANRKYNGTSSLGGKVINKLKIRVSNGEAISGELSFSPMALLANDTVDFSPYSNICPITGRTGLSVYRTGKNLIDPAKKVATSTTTAKWYNDGTGFLLHGGQAYALSGNISTDATYFVYFYDMGGTQLAYGKWTATYTPSADVYVYFQYYESGGAHLADAELQLELGSATTYEPYNGNTYSVDWTTQAGTVYGGTVDVVTGVLTVDRAIVDFGSLTWGKYSTTFFYATLTPIAIGTNNILCSQYKPVATSNDVTFRDLADDCIVNTYIGGHGVRVKDSTKSSLSTTDFKTAMSGVQLVYELATPLTYQLTPQEVQMLLGENYVWSSSGDSLSVTYMADGNATPLQALNIMLGSRYVNPGTAEDVSDAEALDILLGR